MAGDQDVEHRVGTQHEGADIAQHAEQGHASSCGCIAVVHRIDDPRNSPADSSANDMRPTEA